MMSKSLKRAKPLIAVTLEHDLYCAFYGSTTVDLASGRLIASERTTFDPPRLIRAGTRAG